MDSKNLMTLLEFQKQISDLNDWAQHGCSDGFCQIERTEGMHTNNRCTCDPHDFLEKLFWLACELDKYGKYGRWTK